MQMPIDRRSRRRAWQGSGSPPGREASPAGTRLSRRIIEWILVGALAGARLYFLAQNDPGRYLAHPWRLFAVWEGGLAFFGGLFGATAAAFAYMRRHGLPFGTTADLFAPAVPVAAAIVRIPCFLAGMDFGTPTRLPWGVIYMNPESYAPLDGIPRHPVQLYELAGDLAIATLLLTLRDRLANGHLCPAYLALFGLLRFLLFFVRGDVPMVAAGLTNVHWTALVIFVVSIVLLVTLRRRRWPRAAA